MSLQTDNKRSLKCLRQHRKKMIDANPCFVNSKNMPVLANELRKKNSYWLLDAFETFEDAFHVRNRLQYQVHRVWGIGELVKVNVIVPKSEGMYQLANMMSYFLVLEARDSEEQMLFLSFKYDIDEMYSLWLRRRLDYVSE